MKKLFVQKIFGTSYLSHSTIVLGAALSFLALYGLELHNSKSYQDRLKNYTESFMKYNEITASKVQTVLEKHTKKMNWQVLSNEEQKIYQSAAKIQSADDGFWNKYEDIHQKYQKSLLKLKKMKFEQAKSSLTKKIGRTLNFVEKNKWKRLTRIFSRIENFAQEDLAKNLSKIESAIESVRKVTENSILSNYEKSAILSRVNRFNEIKILKTSAKSLELIQSLNKNYIEAFTVWHNYIGNKFIERGNVFSNHDLYSSIFLTAALLFTLLAIGSFLFFKKKLHGKQELLERKFEGLIDHLLFDKSDASLEQFSDTFRQFFSRAKSHLFRRMHFGRIAEEGIPFPSFLVDENLKVTWMNKLAQDHFNINFNLSESDYLAWDHIRQFTNFDDFDPIVDCIQFRNGGVFDTKIATGEEKEDRAELFVSPVTIEGQHYSFVCYQLQSYYQEVLDTSKQSILVPLKDTFDYLLKENFEKIDIARKEYAFDSSDTQKIYPTLVQVVNRFQEAILSLKDSLEFAVKDNRDKETEINTLLNSKEVNIEVMVAQTQNFKSLKENISLLDRLVVSSFGELGKLQVMLSEHLNQAGEQQGFYQKLVTDIKRIESNIDSFKGMIRDKKKESDIVRGLKIEINHLLSSNEVNKEKVNGKMSELNGKIEEIDLFNKELDVLLGKLEYYFEEMKSAEKGLHYNLDSFENSIEKEFFHLDQIETNFESVMDNFASNLENQYRVLKKHKMVGSQISESRVNTSDTV